MKMMVIAGQLGGPGYSEAPGLRARFNKPAALVWQGDQLLLADRENHCLRRVDPETGASVLVAGTRVSGHHDGPVHQAAFAQPTGLAIAADGVVYVADTNNHVIRRIDGDQVTTVAGTARSKGSVDGIGTAATFDHPRHLALAGDSVFIADTGSQKLRLLDLRTLTTSTLQAEINQIGALWCHGGSLFLGDDETLRRLDLATGVLSTVAGGTKSSLPRDGVGDEAGFSRGSFTAMCGDGDLLYVGGAGHGIRRIDTTTYRVTTIGAALLAVEDGSETAPAFWDPWGIAVRAGAAFVADAFIHDIRKVDLATEVISQVAGRPRKREATDGTGTETSVKYMKGLSVMHDEEVLFVIEGMPLELRRIRLRDRNVWKIKMYEWPGTPAHVTATAQGPGELLYVLGEDHTLRTFNRQSWSMTTITGAPGERAQMDGPLATARLAEPIALCVVGDDIIIAEKFANLLRRVRLTEQTIETVAGGADRRTFKDRDGVGLQARFDRIGGLATDGVGTVFVADTGANAIRRVDLATRTVTTLAGAGQPGFVDGIGAAARFDRPVNLAYIAPYVYVSDETNRAVRRVHAVTGEVTTVLGGRGQFVADPAAGHINGPGWIDATSDGSLVLVDMNEHVILRISGL